MLRPCSLFAAATSALMLLAGAPAEARIIQVPAAAFPSRSGGIGGMFNPQTGTYDFYSQFDVSVPIVFPTQGRVCSFSVFFRDASERRAFTADLVKKSFVVGGDALSPSTVMATISSGRGGASDAVQRRGTDAIIEPDIERLSAFYYVRLRGFVSASVAEVSVLGFNIRISDPGEVGCQGDD